MESIITEQPAIAEEQSLASDIVEGQEPLTGIEEIQTPEETPVTPEVVIPEVYELPEGFIELEGFDTHLVGKELGLDQDKFNTLVSKYGELENIRMTKEQEARVAHFRETISEKEQASFEAKAKGALGDDYELLRDAMSGSLSAPASVAKLVKQYIMKTEHNLTPQVQAAPALTEGDLREMMRDPRYKTDTDFRSRVSAGFAKLYN